jgi:hypothetical protein
VARGGQPDAGPPSYLHVERAGPESTQTGEHVVTFMLIHRADRETEAYNEESGQ